MPIRPLLCLMLALGLTAAPVLANQPPAIALPAGPAYPNGIAVAPDGTIFTGFVTSGRIVRKRPGQDWDTFFPGSDAIYAATSLRLDAGRNLLWGTSPDFLTEGRAPRPNRLFALDADTGAVRRLVDFPKESFANDTAIEADGAVLVTDSLLGRVLRLRPGAGRFEVAAMHPDLAPPPGGVGVAGIARAPDGRLAVSNFGTGKLFAVERDRTIRPIRLPRLLANPDGLAFAADGALLVCEGDIAGGNGRVLRIAAPFAPSERPLETLAEGLESPVNLSLAPDGELLVTEARIRHRLVETGKLPTPASFRIVRLALGGG